MTADELASFRALLRAQAAGPPRRGRVFPARGRSADAGAPAGVAAAAPVFAGWETVAEPLPATAWPVQPLADPPLRAPPLFGRREAEEAPALAERPTAPVGCAEPLTLAAALPPPAPHLWEVGPSTPEEEPSRSRAPAAAPVGGGGWTRARPPSAQRRLLARLEAVFLAERLGLDARREAQRG